jgi:hypothetical protein
MRRSPSVAEGEETGVPTFRTRAVAGCQGRRFIQKEQLGVMARRQDRPLAARKPDDHSSRFEHNCPATITMFLVILKDPFFQSFPRFLNGFGRVARVASHIGIAHHPEKVLHVVQDEFSQKQPVRLQNGSHRGPPPNGSTHLGSSFLGC